VEVILNILLHLMLIGSMLAFVSCAVVVTFKAPNQLERTIRASALFCGAMVVLGSQAAGVSFADFTVTSLSNTNLGAKIVGAAVPGAIGLALGKYIAWSLRRSETIAIRVLAFVGTLAASQFAWIYAVAVKANGLALGPAVIPNIAFAVGILLYVVFVFEPGKRGPQQRKPGRLRQLLSGEVTVRVGTRPPDDQPPETMLNRNSGK
jgi:hypothetical protein